MDMHTKSSPSAEELRHAHDNYLDNLLEMNVQFKGRDKSNVLDYETPGSVDPVLLPTYVDLPYVKYVSFTYTSS